MGAPSEPSSGIRLVLELTELAEQMLRQRLRRTRPELTDEDIERRVDAWYAKRPGAEQGDSAGRPVDVRERFG